MEYFVLNEHTLCHREPGWRLAGVLAISPLRGGHDLGPLPIMATDKVRPATVDDFAAFRVSPVGHLFPCPSGGTVKMVEQGIRDKLISYMSKRPGSVPNWATIGGYSVAKPVLDAMIEEGRIVRGVKLSKTGRRMSTLFLSEHAHLSA